MEGHTHPLHHQYPHQQQQQQHPQHQHQHQQQQQQQQMISGAGPVAAEGGSGDRFPQWSIQETKEFLGIRAELDRTFMETKRNKLLWEVISTKMREFGYLRSAEQCKCKWKNLVTRYKGCETMEPEAMRQNFPFYNEMQAIFTARMQRMLWAETEGGGPGPSTKKNKPQSQTMSSEDEDEDDSDGEPNKGTKRKAKKAKIGCTSNSNSNNNSSSSISHINAVKEMLEKFMKQQMEMEVQWREAYEAREEERRRMENEWRSRMEALEKERLLLERRWREREEQRRVREDARADQRDALINALLNKLQRDP
ncbi:hypothetical protein vseg_006013 [Gypsophila vaccaria]